MSSRVFKATTSDSPKNPQKCGLTGVPIKEGDECFYLVCSGREARPAFQIIAVAEEEQVIRGRKVKKTHRETPDGKKFFSVFTGNWETYVKSDGTKGKRRVYEWQTEGPGGARIPVTVWSQMVLADAALKLGYKVMTDAKGAFVKTKAHKGDRTRGFEHQHGEEEPAMVTIAKAALSDEDAGVVPPSEPVAEAGLKLGLIVPVAVGVADEEAANAAALGMTVEQFRKINADLVA